MLFLFFFSFEYFQNVSIFWFSFSMFGFFLFLSIIRWDNADTYSKTLNRSTLRDHHQCARQMENKWSCQVHSLSLHYVLITPWLHSIYKCKVKNAATAAAKKVRQRVNNWVFAAEWKKKSASSVTHCIIKY